LAHDFALRGVRVTLVERGELTSGTTGRHHGLLHNGGRYAVNDRDSASECIEENRMLRRICPGTFELNDGLFVAVAEEDLDYLEPFLEGCAACGIPTQSPTPAHALRLEPNLNPELKAAVRIPDGTIDAMRLALRFFATAHHNGADIRSYTEVTALPIQGGLVSGAVVHDHVTGRSDDSTRISWSTRRAHGRRRSRRWRVSTCRSARPRASCSPSAAGSATPSSTAFRRSGDGDIVVPQRGLSVVGTSSWVVDDPDDLSVPEDHVERMYSEGAKLIPAVRDAERRAAWSAARPLVGSRGEADTGRELSRTFKTFDHNETDGVEGLVTITGGKATTGSPSPAIRAVSMTQPRSARCRSRSAWAGRSRSASRPVNVP